MGFVDDIPEIFGRQIRGLRRVGERKFFIPLTGIQNGPDFWQIRSAAGKEDFGGEAVFRTEFR